ncbi:hypothetical protein [Mangrovimonas sp. ST2L15]|uniref:hypothetical protein n=1 Tax=Mangrovimonas sp. ST2L15 TaxID=1645916 RepID=UPI0006B51628|nr:hypothetical protein [Mangrovimonas sp. ST2L15]
MNNKPFFRLYYLLYSIFGALLVSSCSQSENQIADFEFWKINIVTPNPQRTIDSLVNKYNLQYKGKTSKQNGFVSGSLELANASLQIKTYLDSSEHEPGPTEITILTNLPDSMAYKQLKEKGLDINKPFRREGWNFSVITIPDLKILGEKSYGIYVCKLDGSKEDMVENAKWRDSVRSLTNVRLETVSVFAPNATELKKSFTKLKLGGKKPPKFNFIVDSVYKMEIEIK